MADFFKDSSSPRTRFQRVIWSIKNGLLLIGIISTCFALKIKIPNLFSLFPCVLPRIWISFYIILNLILISMRASSSNFKQNLSEKKTEVEEERETEEGEEVEREIEYPRRKHQLENIFEVDEFVIDSGEKYTDTSSPDFPLVTSCLPESGKREATSRKSIEKTSQRNGKSVVAVKKMVTVESKNQNDSLDETWDLINEGRDRPAAKHLRKSDTWNVPIRMRRPDPNFSSGRWGLNKSDDSDTFNDPTSSPLSGAGPLSRGGAGRMRERSLSRDELNQRVEMFIKKVKNEIRLQRQESYRRFMEMVNRGVR